MDEKSFDALFQTAVKQTGAEYVEARDAIVRADPPPIDLLQARQASADWRTALTAEILAGWITRHALFTTCERQLRGEVRSGGAPISGTLSPVRRIDTVASMGRPVVPLLLEKIYKIRDYGDSAQTTTALGALAKIRDPMAVPPLIELARSAENERVRMLAASALGPLGDRSAAGVLLTILRDDNEPRDMRATAAMSLGTLGIAEAAPDLRAVVTDEKLDLDFRKAAVRAIAELHDSGSTAALLQALHGAQDLVLLYVIVEALGEVGGAEAFAEVNKLERAHPDEHIRTAAREARDKISAAAR